MKPILRLLFSFAVLLPAVACLGAPAAEPPAGAWTPAPAPTAAPGPSPQAEVSTAPAQPSGLRVAFLQNGNLWLWSESTPARQLTSDGDAARVRFSDDGAVIAYQRGQSLWAVNADGSNPRLLVDVPSYALPLLPLHRENRSLRPAQFEFQPGAHRVYFTTEWAGESDRIASLDLHRVDADAPAPQTLLTSDGGHFTFSPDGGRLALTSPTAIQVIDADGAGLIPALHYPMLTWREGRPPQMVWMENGSGLYTILPGGADGKFIFLFIYAEGGFSAQLAEFWAAPDTIPLLSPDGSKVAYVLQADSSSDLHVIDASTADLVIASHPGGSTLELLGWLPDSGRILYHAGTPTLLLAGIGFSSTPLVEGAAPHSLRWVSADQFLYFANGELRLGQVGNPNRTVIASGFPAEQQEADRYDFVP